MASGFSNTLDGGSEGFSCTLDGGSEEMFDFVCSPCDRRGNKPVQALNYCTDCDELYCKTCLEFHASFPGLRDHTVIGQDQVDSWGRKKATHSSLSIKKNQSTPTEQCPQHQGKVLEKYCGNHDRLCCHVCVSLNHRACVDMKHVAEMSRGISKSSELHRMKGKLDQIQYEMDQMKTARKKHRETLDESKRNILESLKIFRDRVNKVFDALEKKVVDDFEKLYNDNIKLIQGDIDVCDNLTAELTQLNQQLDTNHTNESQLFINIKKCEAKVSEGDKLIQNVFATPMKHYAELVFDEKLEKFLDNLKILGKLETKVGKDVPFPTAKTVKVSQLYQATHGMDKNIRIESDNKLCHIMGGCFLPDQTIILADEGNKKLKHLNTSYEVINHCDLPDSLRAVCCVDQQNVIAADKNKTIHFVSVRNNKVTLSQSVKMDHSTFSVAYKDGKLFVCDLTKVYIYDLYDMQCLHTICTDSNGVKLFAKVMNIAVSPDDTKIYVTDFQKGLVTLDCNGKLLSTYNLSAIQGLCVDEQGFVYVCGPFSRKVVQLDKTGAREVGVVVRFGADVNLRTVLVNNRNTVMIVSRYSLETGACGFDTIKVFNLKKRTEESLV